MPNRIGRRSAATPDRILSALPEREAITTLQLSAQLGMSQEAVRLCLHALYNSGQIGMERRAIGIGRKEVAWWYRL